MTPEEMKRQKRITQQWKSFATTYGKEAYEDLMEYAEMQREMYRKYGEELTMPNPLGDGIVPIDVNMAAILLQNSRGINIMRTYIHSRVNAEDVVQPKKTK